MKKATKFFSIFFFLAAGGFAGSFIYSLIVQKSDYPEKNQNFFLASESRPYAYPYRNWDYKDPEISAESAILIDLDDDFIFYQKNSNIRRPIASLTKLMTALIAKERINNETPINITEQAINIEGDSGNGLFKGEIFKASELIKLMLLASSNKAAIALSESVLKEDFIRLMNEKAKELNMSQTNFFEPSGLSISNQSSTEDLIKLCRYINKNYPEIFAITQENKMFLTSYDGKTNHQVKNINLFSHYPKFLEEIKSKNLGGKTGFTEEAKEAYAGIFSFASEKFFGQEKRIMVIVLRSESRYNDIETLLRWIRKAYVF